jgi:hypothetical protein
LHTNDFKVLLGLFSTFVPSTGSGLDELLKITDVLKERKKRFDRFDIRFVSERTIVYERSQGNVFIKALSPSAPAILASGARFERELHPQGQGRSKIPSLEPNDLSIVLTIRLEEIRLLLGADLEVSGTAGCGWQALIDDFANTDNSHEGFKVPHHGSSNGHHDEIWPKLLRGDAWAVVTPWLRGKQYLPQDTDIQRIASQGPYTYSTARRLTKTYRHPESVVQSQLREMKVDLVTEHPSQGQVRLRKKLTPSRSDWTVEFFGDACELVDLL